ncbi:MAG: helix-turn-helix transcriptional regulator [Proteobacteria bacterium]|nr:helix-turn-helix transcriptional regulator [Pseudomonadota bacterium]MBU1138769.1 helix-turn-helix transcriptional regulator [Pseudomonadota bacterium]MBU1233566.1 helix-turn-helix transcriptional regulator [Pseudomonadota bacterium]MBU1418052.1 helix-turn-helix transcriptional regulator [Pseudomonadota bacterium]MBU1454088.1 helix-turn-helix transcriptional regulator [Pseudomonadota bacterium]
MKSSIYEVIVNSLSAHVALLDSRGIIIETNRAWRQYGAENGLQGGRDSIGTNYLAVCETAMAGGEEEGELVIIGIQKVLAGELLEFVTQYPCHSPTRHRWFNLRILPYLSEKEHRVIVVHEDITPIILSQEELRSKEEELREKSEQLEETNIALKILLEHRDRDLVALEQRMTANIRELVLPYVEKLKSSTRKKSREQALLDIVESHLNDIVTPFLNRLSSLHLLLTPQELEVATLVRQGKSSQELAELMSVSLSTISFHRKNLRSKLGLQDRSRNLRTYLLSLE